MPEANARSTIVWSRASGTTTWLRILADGSLEVERFDYSPLAHEHFGRDIAFLDTVAEAGVTRLVEFLSGQECGPIAGDAELLAAIPRHFSDFHALRTWLESEGIPCQRTVDEWA